MNTEKLIKEAIDRVALSESTAKEWWYKLSLDEQSDYVLNHPGTRLKVREFDIPIGTVQYLPGEQQRILTHDNNWIYYDKDEKSDLEEEKARVQNFLDMMRHRIGKTSNDEIIEEESSEITEEELSTIMDRVIDRLIENEYSEVDSINTIYKNQLRNEKDSGMFVPMRRNTGSGKYDKFEQQNSRARDDV